MRKTNDPSPFRRSRFGPKAGSGSGLSHASAIEQSLTRPLRAAHSPLSRSFGAALRSSIGPAPSDLLIVISVTRSHEPSGYAVLESRSPPHIRRPRAVTKRPRQAAAAASTWRGRSHRDEHCPISTAEQADLARALQRPKSSHACVQVPVVVTTVKLARSSTNVPYSAAGPVCTA